jgi:2-C-methyl-D-erythritol 4-phosphate cytidylyltransferase
MPKKNIAIIVAAGEGKRFGGGVPKQFLEIAGKPLIIHTLWRFENCPEIDEIILVLATAHIANFRSISEKFNLKKLSKVIAGGSTRAESVFHGFKEVDSESPGIIAVHDGARPLVTVEEISATIEKAEETGAACLAAPVTDTIKEISGDKIVRTINRTRLRRALTPQCFRYDILRRAFAENNLNEEATDESFLAEKIGAAVSLVEGSAKNIKITHREDFAVAEILLKDY